jgi:selenocysteine lyase/cysteine desulfurase
LIGPSGFVAGGTRSASAVARSDSWVLEFGPRARHLPGLPGRSLREATLTVLRLQLRAANHAFTEIVSDQAKLQELLQAASHLQGWRAGDPLTGLRFEDLSSPQEVNPPDAEFEQLCGLIRNSVIGREAAIETPFGLRRMVYADYTASGRSLTFIEDFLRERVLPLYANTHTEASASGLQTTQLREQARKSVARSVNATEVDEIIFVGSGATGAINRLVDILGLRDPHDRQRTLPESARPVVFIGPYEHHSNILPWRHSLADVVEIPVNDEGKLDLETLEAELVRHAGRPSLIGSFSAASNVTGLATPVDEVARILHAHGALSFWDYAAAGPYVPIDMNPAKEGAHKDAIFLSPHKFAGGPGTPGVLVLKKSLVTSSVPTQPGGGTVDFVTASDSLYSSSIASREESGTPAIIESIRCGLVFRLKDQAQAHRIHDMETRYVRAAIDSWTQNYKIRVLGPLDAERISIVSFLIRHGRGYLHYNFVVALLNDLFGLQARGGCSCAGPYGGRLFGLDEESGREYLELARQGLSCYKPGWARVNFNYFISEEEFHYIIQAVHLVAMHGYALLPQYEMDAASGIWSHRSGHGFVPASLSDLDLSGGKAQWPRTAQKLPDDVLSRQLAEGRRILEEATHAVPDPVAMPELSPKEARWRWFPLPGEQSAWLRHINGQAERPDHSAGIFAREV